MAKGRRVTHCKPDPERLAVIGECMETYGQENNDPGSEWPWNCLSTKAVTYSCGAIVRTGDDVEHNHDPAELDLCRRLSAEAARFTPRPGSPWSPCGRRGGGGSRSCGIARAMPRPCGRGVPSSSGSGGKGPARPGVRDDRREPAGGSEWGLCVPPAGGGPHGGGEPRGPRRLCRAHLANRPAPRCPRLDQAA
jgi:hypothetical protein